MADENRWRDENRFDRDEWDRSRYDAWRGMDREYLSWGSRPGSYGREFGDSYPYYGRFGYGRDYGAPPYRGYGHDAWGRPASQRRIWDPQRGFWERAADEVSSWFGDDEAMQRRDLDAQNWNRRGLGPKGYIRSDERIREDVCDRLSDDPMVDASEMDVTVTGGEVTLAGSAITREERRRAEECAERVSGVTHVQNNLRVPRSGGTMGATPTAARTSTGAGRNDTGRPAH